MDTVQLTIVTVYEYSYCRQARVVVAVKISDRTESTGWVADQDIWSDQGIPA